MLDFTTSEMVELILACNKAIQNEMDLIHKYEETMPWKAKRYKKALHELESAKEKIFQALKGV